jgi:hypothetical protein
MATEMAASRSWNIYCENRQNSDSHLGRGLTGVRAEAGADNRGQKTVEVVYGITKLAPEKAYAAALLMRSPRSRADREPVA